MWFNKSKLEYICISLLFSRLFLSDVFLFVSCSYLCCLSLILQPSNDVDVKILAGDEVIQVNDQVVVSDTVYMCM